MHPSLQTTHIQYTSNFMYCFIRDVMWSILNQLLQYMVIPIELLSNPSMDITSFRANLGVMYFASGLTVENSCSIESYCG